MMTAGSGGRRKPRKQGCGVTVPHSGSAELGMQIGSHVLPAGSCGYPLLFASLSYIFTDEE